MEDDRKRIEEYLNKAEQAGCPRLADEQRAAMCDLADHTAIGMALIDFWQKSADAQIQLVDAIFRMATFPSGNVQPVTDIITPTFINAICDNDLCETIFRFVCEWFDRNGGYKIQGAHSQAELVALMPKRLRPVYTLTVLEGEVYNGGFVQFFGNSEGEFATETLEDCRLVGAQKKADLLEKAIGLFESITSGVPAAEAPPESDEGAICRPGRPIRYDEFDPLDTEYYRLEEAEPTNRLMTQFIRQNPEACSGNP